MSSYRDTCPECGAPGMRRFSLHTRSGEPVLLTIFNCATHHRSDTDETSSTDGAPCRAGRARRLENIRRAFQEYAWALLAAHLAANGWEVIGGKRK